MAHSPQLFGEDRDILPPFFPGQRQDFLFTPMVVIGEVMHLTIEKRRDSFDTRQERNPGKSKGTVNSRSHSGQCAARVKSTCGAATSMCRSISARASGDSPWMTSGPGSCSGPRRRIQRASSKARASGLIFFNHRCDRFLIRAVGKPKHHLSVLFSGLVAEGRLRREFPRVQRPFVFGLAHGDIMQRKVNVHFFPTRFPRALDGRLHVIAKGHLP